MIYKLGKIGAIEGMALIAMISLPNVYLSEPSVLIGFAGSAAWLAKLLGGGITAAALLIILRLYRLHSERFHEGRRIDFFQFARELLGEGKARWLFFVWALVFQIQTVLLLREFGDHVMITTLPNSRLPLIVFLLVICITLLMLRGLEVMLRAAYLVFVVSAAGILLSLALLFEFFDFDYLFPALGHGASSLLRYSVSDTGSWLLCFSVLFIAPYLQKISTVRQSILYGIGYVAVLKSLLIIGAILLMGTVIAPERTLLFYEMVQAINLSQYLQRVDAVFILLWLPGGLLSAALMQFFALTLFCRVFRLNDFPALVAPAVFTSAVFSLSNISVAEVITVNCWFIYGASCFWLLANLAAFCGAYYVKYRRGAACAVK